uniref:Uncharacterized protein n=1 Tax=Plectus sambesii TaxID=2011161 RepID=A0A914W0V4_9BILA
MARVGARGVLAARKICGLRGKWASVVLTSGNGGERRRGSGGGAFARPQFSTAQRRRRLPGRALDLIDSRERCVAPQRGPRWRSVHAGRSYLARVPECHRPLRCAPVVAPKEARWLMSLAAAVPEVRLINGGARVARSTPPLPTKSQSDMAAISGRLSAATSKLPIAKRRALGYRPPSMGPIHLRAHDAREMKTLLLLLLPVASNRVSRRPPARSGRLAPFVAFAVAAAAYLLPQRTAAAAGIFLLAIRGDLRLVATTAGRSRPKRCVAIISAARHFARR